MNKEKLQQLAHLIAGVIIILHGFRVLEQEEYFTAAGYLIIAIAFVIAAGLHKRLQQVFMQSDAAIFLLEALILFLAAYGYKADGRDFYYYAFLTAAGFYLLIACFNVQIDPNPRRGSRRKKKKRRTGLEDEFLRSVQRQQPNQ